MTSTCVENSAQQSNFRTHSTSMQKTSSSHAKTASSIATVKFIATPSIAPLANALKNN